LPAVGSAFGGGFFAGQISTAGNGIADYNLVVGPKSSAQTQNTWKTSNTATPGADSNIDGPQNTADIVADGAQNVYFCAHFCNDLVIGGFSDWYMPAFNEVGVCYFNLKPSGTSNFTGSGINPNAVPARASNYTSDNPAQTSAAAFQTGGAEEFETAQEFWSSTEFSATSVKKTSFLNGSQYNGNKSFSSRVRAIRRVAV
jgi:hypothetical protein